MHILLFLFLFGFFAVGEDKVSEKSPDIFTKKVEVVIVDKLYANKYKYNLDIGKTASFEKLDVKIIKCVENNSGQKFAFLKVKDSGKEITSKWFPVTLYSSSTLEHKRFDVIVTNCYL